jgi:hypothetical protein
MYTKHVKQDKSNMRRVPKTQTSSSDKTQAKGGPSPTHIDKDNDQRTSKKTNIGIFLLKTIKVAKTPDCCSCPMLRRDAATRDEREREIIKDQA